MRILLIAYYFPPLTGGGSMRPARWAEHLRQRGHHVTVLTHTYGPSHRDGDVVRVHDPSHNRHRLGLRRLQWAALRASIELLNRCGHPASVYSPWRRRAVEVGHRLVAEERPDLILATYSPVETFEIGLALTSDGSPELVADFRDGLLFEPIEQRRLAAHPCVARSYAAIEAAVVDRAAAITAALPLVASDLATRYGLSTTHALPNAIDPSDFVDLPELHLDTTLFHLVHTGGFAASDKTCNIAPFAEAVAVLAAEQPELGRRLRIHQLGRLSPSERHLLRDLVNSGQVIDHGEVDRRTCLAYQRQADALLLITSTIRSSVSPGKLFEYLGAGRPVLGLTRGTFAAELISKTGAGWLTDPEDRPAINRRLASIIDGEVEPRPNHRRIKDLGIDSHIKHLEQILTATGARLQR